MLGLRLARSASARGATIQTEGKVAYGHGTDNIDVASATVRGLVATDVPTAASRAVAEHALFLVLALARRACAIRGSSWQCGDPMELEGRTLGTVGLGNVGGTLLRMLSGFAWHVLVHTPRRRGSWPARPRVGSTNCSSAQASRSSPSPRPPRRAG